MTLRANDWEQRRPWCGAPSELGGPRQGGSDQSCPLGQRGSGGQERSLKRALSVLGGPRRSSSWPRFWSVTRSCCWDLEKLFHLFCFFFVATVCTAAFLPAPVCESLSTGNKPSPSKTDSLGVYPPAPLWALSPAAGPTLAPPLCKSSPSLDSLSELQTAVAA